MASRRDDAAVQFANESHATNETLEQYAMGRLVEPELAAVEEHLLACEACQDRLADEEFIRKGVRVGGIALGQPLAPEKRHSPRLAWILGLAAMVLLVLGGLLRLTLHRPPASLSVIVLHATRGTEQPVPAAAAGRPLNVALDLTDLPQFAVYRMEIVDSRGHTAFEYSGAARANQMRVTLSSGLAAGNYFVRVFGPGPELLREYALSLRAE